MHRTRLITLGLALLALTASLPAAAQDKRAAVKGHAWSLDEAMQQLRLYPRDAYLQYVALQLAAREGRLQEISDRIDRLQGGNQDMFGGNERVNRVDLFSLFSGSLAVQESLQLDTMRGPEGRRQRRQGQIRLAPPPPPGGAPAKDEDPILASSRRKAERVKVADLIGPTIKSHPWAKMLASKKPDVGPMAACVPDDFYFIEFRSVTKMLEVMDQSDLWSTHLFNQAAQEARTQLVGERLKKQLAIETTKLLRPFYDTVVEQVAVTGSDLFLREGSDVTLLFRSKQPDLLRARMNGFLANAEKANPAARRQEGDYLGTPFTHLATPDRALSVYSAYPTPELHVRSNSRIAFERVIVAIQGKDAKGAAVRRLGETDEFKYIRTLMPRGAQEEDGFVYLSDPFIRRLVGPEVKLTERRRMICYNHLRMIGHAALLYQTEHGKPPASLEVLRDSGCAPGLFGKDNLTCPDGGTYTLSADGMTGICSQHGHAAWLRPCCEIPVREVDGEEAHEYKQFLDEYNRYWQTFFDPIALRIQITPQRYRMETLVLPLLDNSVYTSLAQVLGGKPEPLDRLPVPQRNIFSINLQLNKQALLENLGMGHLLADAKQGEKEGKLEADTLKVVNHLKEIGLGLHNYHDTNGHFPTAVSFDDKGKRSGLSWRVHILPYLEQDALYRQFNLKEPWDSEHNRKLITKIPPLFQSSNPKLTVAGKTRLVAPVGEGMLFPSRKVAVRLADVTDGTSNTIMLTEVADEHAVVWTKPDDLEVDLKTPLQGLAIRKPGAFLVLLADGSVRFLNKDINPKTLTALFTRNGGEVFAFQGRDEITLPQSGDLGLLGFNMDLIHRLKMGEFLAKGIGNQVGLHVYDSEPMFDFSLPNFLGMALGTFNGRNLLGSEALPIAVMLSSLNSPVYIAIPVQEPKIVDEFLTRLDEWLAVMAREKDALGGFLRIEQDYYQMPGGQGKNLRSYGFRFGPLKWRFFWGRIGNGLYVASKPYILEDLAALESGKQPAVLDHGPVGHGMVRIRPQHWNRVLTDYRLGWAENNREACIHNLGPLSSLSRALAARNPGRTADEMEVELRRMSARLYGVHFFCPDEGRYAATADGKAVTCTAHGSAIAPRQQAAPTATSSLGKLLREFTDMTLVITFTEEGLQAVVTIDRK